MKTLQEQHALLKFWADGTDFVLDAHKSPKAEFARLAQRKRWIGGDANWKTHWQACFEEAYSYGVGRKFLLCLPNSEICS
ncbi:hypothetical protein P153DRAFT_331938 [Dothidotthia symphoricarpi CBS 119687]|uniref:Uncharacterized protein n=1 Tax=Dothidotthia symphoricarpi CBS 119687 TaxID=1392245 RepID=A0A6A6AQ34_9PLEO|nr:uncharacterized protein P153DRAFT_331938 [Dothidotthia symphoricarpi CBS 119687]KAF2133313.1 hypothetical protein P153DRAFT_331938 [Dothidotthia symphoricarpi CBS 119687]